MATEPLCTSNFQSCSYDTHSNFGLTASDLIALMEQPRDKISENVAALGGKTGIAKALRANLHNGLDPDNVEDIKQRQDAFGRNYIPAPKQRGFFALMWDSFQDITIIVLSISGVISIVLSETVGDDKKAGWIEGACILLAVLLVTVVTAFNDYNKEKQFRSLRAIKEDEKSKVVRDGQSKELSKADLVIGDIVRFDLGDILPADGILTDGNEIKVDESAMTGESDLLSVTMDTPLLLSGTKVMEGYGKMLVLCVGEKTQSGIVEKLILQAHRGSTTEETSEHVPGEDMKREQRRPRTSNRTQSPLEGKLYKLTILIGKFGTLVALLVLITMSVRFSIENFLVDKEEWHSKYISTYLQFFITSITVLVVAIPEGLPLAVTISLAYSVNKMLANHNLVRHLNACETMGSATTICSDKTGTITTNRMTVMQLFIADIEYCSASSFVASTSDTVKDIFCIGICVNSTAEILHLESTRPTHTGNKTECALLQYAHDCGATYSTIRQGFQVERVLTFNSLRKRMSTIVKDRDGITRVYTKGATEIVLDLCTCLLDRNGASVPLSIKAKKDLKTRIVDTYASQGYRTLCLAYRDICAPMWQVKTYSDSDIEKELTFIAIVGIEDPVRPQVPQAIQDCHRAGIVVRMVTGDNILTARSIASKCGIIRNSRSSLVMEGKEFRARVLDEHGNLNQDEFDKIWPNLLVLARSSPQDKHTLVTGLMQTSISPYGPQVVAVTGDGTNDAPALKKANVGFAMGISGTAVAKDASDIILMNDDFSSIVSAIKWGRNVYDSIAKFLQFQLTVNIVAIMLAFVGSVFLDQSPLSAVQMLWINLIMDSFASLALATEPPTDALLDRKPYPKTQPLLSKIMTKHIIGQAVYQLSVLLTLTFAGDRILDIPSGRMADLRKGKTNVPTVHMTIVFNTFVWMQLFNELNCRKIHDELNILRGIKGNRVLLYVAVFQIAMQIILVECTGIYFNTTSLSAKHWMLCLALGFLSIPIGLVLRGLSDKRLPQWMACCREAEPVSITAMPSAQGHELWLRGFKRMRAQLRAVKAFQGALEPASI